MFKLLKAGVEKRTRTKPAFLSLQALNACCTHGGCRQTAERKSTFLTFSFPHKGQHLLFFLFFKTSSLASSVQTSTHSFSDRLLKALWASCLKANRILYIFYFLSVVDVFFSFVFFYKCCVLLNLQLLNLFAFCEKTNHLSGRLLSASSKMSTSL